MSYRYVSSVVVVASVAALAQAQTFQRRATPLNERNGGEGRCVVEVVVDGAAQVEIRGDNASLRNLKGQAPQWRRFECTSPLPPNPPNFRFKGIDGRGRQELVQPPQGTGVAVVRIDDPDNGQEGYTFEITWGGEMRGPVGQSYPVQVLPAPPPDRRDDGDRRPGRFLTDDAVRLCQSYVRDQAARRFGARDVIFRRTLMDDQPGRNDWVKGFFETRGLAGRPRNYRFSCSVNFDTGQVRSADVQPMPNGQDAFGDSAVSRAIQACEASVEQRLTNDGYRRIDFGSVSPDDRPGRGDLVTGSATALERDRPVWFDFSCSANLREGSVRSAEVTRR